MKPKEEDFSIQNTLDKVDHPESKQRLSVTSLQPKQASSTTRLPYRQRVSSHDITNEYEEKQRIDAAKDTFRQSNNSKRSGSWGENTPTNYMHQVTAEFIQLSERAQSPMLLSSLKKQAEDTNEDLHKLNGLDNISQRESQSNESSKQIEHFTEYEQQMRKVIDLEQINET